MANIFSFTRPISVTSALVVRVAQRYAIAAVLARVQLARFDLFVAKTARVPVLAFALETVATGQQTFAEHAVAQIAVGQRAERPCDTPYDEGKRYERIYYVLLIRACYRCSSRDIYSSEFAWFFVVRTYRRWRKGSAGTIRFESDWSPGFWPERRVSFWIRRLYIYLQKI